MVDDVLAAVSHANGETIALGADPTVSFITISAFDGASNEASHDVLMRALNATARRELSRQILCRPVADGGNCLLNFHAVRGSA